MEEYISKTVLLKFIETLEIKEDDDPGHNKGLNDALHKYFPQIINSVIVADVQEVKHAKWIDNTQWIGKFGMCYYICSNCGNSISGKPKSKGNGKGGKYCDECGAKMDLEGE